MDLPLAGSLAIDLLQERQEFCMRVARLAGFDHVALQDVQAANSVVVPCRV